jgi:hypothetical protein
MAEQAAFPSFKRHPLEGLAIHHVRYAEALLDIGRAREARAIMSSIETIGGEPFVVQDTKHVAVDMSQPDRARVWARLGDVPRAMHWWNELPEPLDSLDDKLDVLVTLTGALARAQVALPNRHLFTQQREDEERWYRIVSVFAAVGEYDGQMSRLGPLERARSLEQLQRLSQSIDDPRQKSRAYAAIARRMLEAGMPRAALAISAKARPGDQVVNLAKAVERYL